MAVKVFVHAVTHNSVSLTGATTVRWSMASERAEVATGSETIPGVQAVVRKYATAEVSGTGTCPLTATGATGSLVWSESLGDGSSTQSNTLTNMEVVEIGGGQPAGAGTEWTIRLRNNGTPVKS